MLGEENKLWRLWVRNFLQQTKVGSFTAAVAVPMKSYKNRKSHLYKKTLLPLHCVFFGLPADSLAHGSVLLPPHCKSEASPRGQEQDGPIESNGRRIVNGDTEWIWKKRPWTILLYYSSIWLNEMIITTKAAVRTEGLLPRIRPGPFRI